MGEWVETPEPPYWKWLANPVPPEPPVTHILNQVEPLEPVARTAGEQDHSDPWAYAGEDAPAPEPVP